MRWVVSDWGMHMTLARNVPEKIATSVRGVVTDIYRRAGLSWAEQLKRSVFAVHPGGPKIIDRVREVLELDEAQVKTSRAVLADHGNMSSATLPYIWARLAADPSVASGTLIASLAFGPGLTICGGLFRKQ
jgi:predicted naringenin-chalcone synthase